MDGTSDSPLSIAHRARRDGDNERAARYYALEAFDALVQRRRKEGKVWLEAGVAAGVRWLLNSAICYRLSGNREACKIRCYQGIATVTDVDEYVFDDDPLHGAAREVIGDFRVVGRLGGHRDEYAAAREVYAAYEDRTSETWDVIKWQTEDVPQFWLAPFLQVADAVGHEFESTDRIRTTSFLARVDAKIAHFEDLLDELDSIGEWHWEET